MLGFSIILKFFTTEPYACDPSSLPKYPPSKEMDAKRRDDEVRRYVCSYICFLHIHYVFLVHSLSFVTGVHHLM